MIEESVCSFGRPTRAALTKPFPVVLQINAWSHLNTKPNFASRFYAFKSVRRVSEREACREFMS